VKKIKKTQKNSEKLRKTQKNSEKIKKNKKNYKKNRFQQTRKYPGRSVNRGLCGTGKKIKKKCRKI